MSGKLEVSCLHCGSLSVAVAKVMVRASGAKEITPKAKIISMLSPRSAGEGITQPQGVLSDGTPYDRVG